MGTRIDKLLATLHKDFPRAKVISTGGGCEGLEVQLPNGTMVFAICCERAKDGRWDCDPSIPSKPSEKWCAYYYRACGPGCLQNEADAERVGLTDAALVKWCRKHAQDAAPKHPDAATLAQIIKEAIEAHNVIGADPDMKIDSDYDETEADTGLCLKDGMWVTVDGRTYHVSVQETSESRARREEE